MCYDFEIPESMKHKSKNAINREEDEEIELEKIEPMTVSN
jgi:hypothetical protein